ncbi:MAG: hypothetical protein VB024_00205 [Dysgonamonadaceae bacterium]|nr:hypothetical protein [Dysgonamonadaceae bacterium]
MSEKKNDNQSIQGNQPEKIEKRTNLNEERRHDDSQKNRKETSGTGPRSKKK